VRPYLTLTSADAAERIGTNEPHIRRMAREGLIPHYKIGGRYRFDPAELDAWLEAAHVTPTVAR